MDIKSRVIGIQKLISVNKFSQAISECEKLIKKFPENLSPKVFIIFISNCISGKF